MSQSPPRKPIEVFFSYSHQDEPLRNELAKHLSILKQQGIIDVWHDREITAGSEWESMINAHLDSADVILLLISADFLASQYCYDTELHRALEKHYAREARVIPVILRPVDWSGAPFAKLQALPKHAKAITTWANQDEAFTDVAQGIRRAVEELTQHRPNRGQVNPYTPPTKKRSHSPPPLSTSSSPDAPSPVSKPSPKPSRKLSQIAWGAIALIPLLWVLISILELQDAFHNAQDLIARFVVGSIGGLLSGGLGAVAWYNMKPTAPLEQLLLYILLCSIAGGGIWSVMGGGESIAGLFVGGITSCFTYWWIHRVCVKP